MPAKKHFEAELIALIENDMAEFPHHFLGRTWAILDSGQDSLADYLGVDPKTLRKTLDGPPFKHRVQKFGDQRKTILSVRKPGEPEFTPDELKYDKAQSDAKIMKAVWKGKIGKAPSDADANLLFGFALDLAAFPDVNPVEVFYHTLTDWPFVMTAIKTRALAEPNFQARYYDFPNIHYIRKFWKAPLHAYVMRLQSDGKIPEAKLNAFAAILQATDFVPIPADVPYPDPEHVAKLIKKKEAKFAAKKAKTTMSEAV